MPESIEILERKLWRVKNPEHRITLLLELSSLYRDKNSELAQGYAIEAVRLCKLVPDFRLPVNKLEVLELMQEECSSADRCELLEYLTVAYENSGDPSRALSYHKQLLEVRLKEAAEKAPFEMAENYTNAEFEIALRRQYPTLTKTERRICSLMKLQLTSQQIADLMYTSLRTVEWHRLNIRKKLQITDHQEIQLFLEESMDSISGK